MVLYREHLAMLKCNTLQRTVKQGFMGGNYIFGQTVAFHHETMVLTGNFNFSALEILDWMICTTMAE